MQNIIAFFLRNRIFFLFILLFVVSLSLTIQSHTYHRSKFINSANWLTGGLYASVNDISSYFGLRDQNQQLLEENKRLRGLLMNQDEVIDSIPMDSTKQFNLITASIIKNSFKKTNNYLTINKGKSLGIENDMGVISSQGIIGIIDNTSANYSVVQSVLNSLSEINASLKNTSYFGTLVWNQKDYRYVQLTDIPKNVNIKKGDTIVTGGMSTIFPKDILIGTIENFELTTSDNYYNISVKLFNDMANVKHVYVIKNKDRKEIIQLENQIKDE
ncbi:rod shape-determining protein MreC [Ascidiimonas sp. W6]|uniref:rod shape-determining protein MreC n=1 Tax=Ascidiimonas meishanensis TaxID=3128903 RepID=UPI0030EE6C91